MRAVSWFRKFGPINETLDLRASIALDLENDLDSPYCFEEEPRNGGSRSQA